MNISTNLDIKQKHVNYIHWTTYRLDSVLLYEDLLYLDESQKHKMLTQSHNCFNIGIGR